MYHYSFREEKLDFFNLTDLLVTAESFYCYHLSTNYNCRYHSYGNEQTVPAIAEDVEVKKEVQKLETTKKIKKKKKTSQKNWKRTRGRGRKFKI